MEMIDLYRYIYIYTYEYKNMATSQKHCLYIDKYIHK